MPEWYPQEIRRYFVQDFHNVLKNYIYLIAMLFALDYFKGQQEAVSRQKELENQLLSAKLQTVESQLRPHFLFNALNGIVATIDENAQKAQHALLQLSDLLRFSLNYQSSELISIADELHLVKRYLAIEQLRYEEQLLVKIEIPHEATAPFPVPGMLLQPLIENAIKHGFKKHEGQLTVHLVIDHTTRTICVKNNGAPLRQHTFNKGLNIVQQRLNYHFPDQHRFSLYQDDAWVVAKIEWYG